MEHENAIEHVRDVFTDAGLGVPVEFSPSKMLNEKIDAGRDPYYVLGACNPEWPIGTGHENLHFMPFRPGENRADCG